MCIRDSLQREGTDIKRHVIIKDLQRDPITGRLRHVDFMRCLLYTSDAADERSSVDLGGRRILKKKNNIDLAWSSDVSTLTQTVRIKRDPR